MVEIWYSFDVIIQKIESQALMSFCLLHNDRFAQPTDINDLTNNDLVKPRCQHWPLFDQPVLFMNHLNYQIGPF